MVHADKTDRMNGIGGRAVSIILLFGAALFAAAMCGPDVSAQVIGGQISGIVKDPSNAPIPGAAISVVNLQTAFERTAITDNDGFYLVTNLPPGSYRVRVEQPGFKTYAEDNIQLTSSDRVSINPVLRIGEVRETVTVSAAGEKVERDSGSVGQLIDGSQVVDLALNGRNLIQLLMVVPGVAVTTDEFDRGAMTFGSIANYNVNGLRATSTAVTVDGGYNQDSGSNTSVTMSGWISSAKSK